jgi:DNA-binding MarR family transcriptional regulator
MEKKLVDSIACIKSSKYRYEVLSKLYRKKLLTPKDISTAIPLRLNHVSMTLKELKEKCLVECINEDAKRGRLYQITELGKMTYEWLEGNE